MIGPGTFVFRSTIRAGFYVTAVVLAWRGLPSAAARETVVTAGPVSPPAAKPPTSGFWLVLVRDNTRWVLRDTLGEGDAPNRDKIVVETFDVRNLGAARVGRLRWTHVAGKEENALDQCGFGCPKRVAVTASGLYFLDEDASDAQILDAIKRPPDRSQPPRPYRATKRNQGRYLRFDGQRLCMGEEPLPGAGDCEDTCVAEVCISGRDGVVQLSGTWAPGFSIFAQPGYE